MYILDLGCTITISTIDFLESKWGRDLDLRIRGIQLQGTPSSSIDRILISRLKEILKNIELLLKEKLNNFEIYILVKSINIKDPREVNSVLKTN